jgi:hypothetical protein
MLHVWHVAVSGPMMLQAVVVGVQVARQQACMGLGGFQQRGSTDMANDGRVASSDPD